MPNKIDEFESRFRSADKPELQYEHVAFRSVLLITDRDQPEADRLMRQARGFLGELDSDKPRWSVVTGGAYGSVDELLRLIETHGPDLIVTHRNLHTASRKPKFSLGTYLDELTQSTKVPVLVLPSDENGDVIDPPPTTRCVLVVADHLTGDNRLVDVGARMTAPGGTLVLAHIEDDATFERYVAEIGKIPDIETDMVHDRLREQLLKAPAEYIDSCVRVLREAGVKMNVEKTVEFGHRLADYRRLMAQHAADLMVFHTRAGSSLGLHGAAYLITATFRDVPLLLL